MSRLIRIGTESDLSPSSDGRASRSEWAPWRLTPASVSDIDQITYAGAPSTKASLAGDRLVIRERLLGKLDSSQGVALTVIIAPAGFGKTTLLRQWASRQNRRIVWVSLQDTGAPLSWFAVQLRSAIATAIPFDSNPFFNQVLPAHRLGSDLYDLVGRFGDFLRAISEELAIILDDYWLAGDGQVHQFVSSLISTLPPNIRFIVAARARPPLPLARLRVRGQLFEIDAGDLRFDLADARQMLGATLGLSLTDEEVLALQSRTEGWAAGLQMAGLTLRSHANIAESIRSFSGNSRLVAEYLASEVVALQPSELRRFLLETSILSTLTASLCDAVLGEQGSQRYLELAEEGGLFLSRLDDHGRWYRYHQLFREQLQASLFTAGADRVRELHRRAAVWYRENGYAWEAIRHSMDAGDWSSLVELVAPVAFPVILAFASVREWLLSLPDDVLETEAKFLVWASFSAFIVADYRRFAKLFALAKYAATGWPTRDLDGLLLAIKAAADYHLGQGLAGLETAREALDVLPHDAHVERIFATDVVGSCNMILGRPVEAEYWFRKAIAMNDGGVMLMAYRVTSMSHLGRVLTMAGRLDEAERVLSRAINLAAQYGIEAPPRTLVFMADIFVNRNELDKAELYLSRARQAYSSTGLTLTVPLYQLVLTRVQWASGVMYETLETLNELVPWSINNDSVLFARRGEAYRARIWIRQGRLDRVREWTKSAGVLSGENLEYERQEAYITYLDLIASDSKSRSGGATLERALEWAARLQSVATADGRQTDALRLRALEALIYEAMGNSQAALRVLESALNLAAQERQIWVFLEAGEAMRSLLERAPGIELRVPFAARVRAAFGAKAGSPPPANALQVEPLSDRERDVLTLLSSGLTNQEIATALYVSANTVKTHIRHVFAKLNVRNRTEALVQARELALV